MQACVCWTDILCGRVACGRIRTGFPYGRDGRSSILGAGGAKKLGWRGSCVEGCLGFIASFSLCPAFPIQAYAVVTSLALPFTVFTFWSFFSTLDLAVLARPGSRSAMVDV